MSLLLYFVLSLSVLVATQTFPGFQPSTAQNLVLSWGETVLNFSGQAPPLIGTQKLATIGLDHACNGTYLLVMVDPDAIHGDIETEDGLHTIQGNFTCAQQSTQVGNKTFYPLSTNSSALAPFIPPEPQPQAKPWIHRYTVLLFQQPSLFQIPPAFKYALPLNTSNVENRLNFSVQAFAQSVDSPLVAANYFDVQGPLETATSTTSPIPTATATTSALATVSSSAAQLSSFSLVNLLSGLLPVGLWLA